MEDALQEHEQLSGRPTAASPSKAAQSTQDDGWDVDRDVEEELVVAQTDSAIPADVNTRATSVECIEKQTRRDVQARDQPPEPDGNFVVTDSHTTANDPLAGSTDKDVSHCGSICRPMDLQDKQGGAFILFLYLHFIEADNFWSLEPQALSILERSWCLHVPVKPVLDQFVRQYFMRIHPVLPLLNEVEFRNVYDGKASPQSNATHISLFLLQAILFLACPVSVMSALKD